MRCTRRTEITFHSDFKRRTFSFSHTDIYVHGHTQTYTFLLVSTYMFMNNNFKENVLTTPQGCNGFWFQVPSAYKNELKDFISDFMLTDITYIAYMGTYLK